MAKIFCINSLPRAGTHMVRDALNRHADATCYAEIFGPPKHRPVWIKGKTIKEAIQWLKAKKSPSVIGFCIHRRELQHELVKYVEREIPSNTLTIYIHRENLLHQCVSALRARQTKVWTVMGRPRTINRPVLHVGIKELTQYFKWMHGLTSEQPRFRRCISFSYEEIVADMGKAFATMQTFLGLEVQPILPQTVKLGTSMRKSIDNYDVLKKHYRGTQWGKFFDE